MRAIEPASDGASTGYCNGCFTGQLPDARRRRPAEAELRRGARRERCSSSAAGGREAAIAWACRPTRPRRARVGRRRCPTPASTPTWSSSAPRPRWSPASPTAAPTSGVPCFGPTAALARLESVKGFTRDARRSRSGLPVAGVPPVDVGRRGHRLVAGVRPPGGGEARRPGRRQGRHRARRRRRDRGRHPRAGRAGPDRARGAAHRPRVQPDGALRRHAWPGRCPSPRTTSASARATPARTPAAWAPTPRHRSRTTPTS